MELKRELTPEEMNKVSGGTGEEQGTGIDDGKQQEHGISMDEQQVFGKKHPVYCRQCKQLLGYSESAGTTGFECLICQITSY